MHPLILVGIFIVSSVLGYVLIKNVPSLLHTPLMSGMNALSGVTVLGAMIAVAAAAFTGSKVLAVIAIALACNPKCLLADEPTTALDVTIQAQVLDMMNDLKKRLGTSLVMITHDLGVIAEMADYVVVMYAGRIVEKGLASEIFHDPRHPYTVGLMASKPVVGKSVDRLYSIPGSVPNPINLPNYCYFKDRCEKCVEKCKGPYPEMVYVTPTHAVSCYLYKDGE